MSASNLSDEAQVTLIKLLNQYKIWDEAVIAGAIVLVVGFCLGWLINFLKTKSEIEKNSSEAINRKLEAIEKLHSKSEKYESAQKILNLQISTLVDLLSQTSKSVVDIKKVREELIHYFSEEYLSSFDKYLDYYEIVKNKEECRQMFNSTVIKLLTVSLTIQVTLNIEEILSQTNSSEFIIHRDSLMRISQFRRRNFKFWHLLSYFKFQKLIKKFHK